MRQGTPAAWEPLLNHLLYRYRAQFELNLARKALTTLMTEHPETDKLKHDVRSVARHFQIYGEFLSAGPYGSGHINDTYCAVFNQGGTPVRYILQRINHNVFKTPAALMENVQRVTAHLSQKVAHQPDSSRCVLTLIPTRDGRACYSRSGRQLLAHLHLHRERPDLRRGGIPATGLPSRPGLRAVPEVAGGFAGPAAARHHSRISIIRPSRFAKLEAAIAADSANRARLARPEIEFALKHKTMTGVLLAAGLPERVTHNDTKLNNVMLDDKTGEGICVIDLDTVMPGLALYDFGDIVRTSTSPAKEDERDLSKVKMQFPMFEALARGYLETAAEFLTKAERQHLAFSGKLITFEIGIRFLTDYPGGGRLFQGPPGGPQPRPLPHPVQAGRIHRAAGRPDEQAGGEALAHRNHQACTQDKGPD